MKNKKFTMTEDHLKLLKRMNVSWWDCEYGAPAIDCKRPYGNSDVGADIHEILTGESIGSSDSKRDTLTDEEEERYRGIHEQMETALQVALASGKFEAGEYEAEEYGDDWHKVGEVVSRARPDVSRQLMDIIGNLTEALISMGSGMGGAPDYERVSACMDSARKKVGEAMEMIDEGKKKEKP